MLKGVFLRERRSPRAGELLTFCAALPAFGAQAAGQVQVARLAQHLFMTLFHLPFFDPKDHHVNLLVRPSLHFSIRSHRKLGAYP